MEKLYILREFSEPLGVRQRTLFELVKTGKIKVIIKHGAWYIENTEIPTLFKVTNFKVKGVAIYARVNDETKKENLEKQVEMLERIATKLFPLNKHTVIKDIASGVDENRKGLRQLIKLVKKRKINVVFVASKERLATVGLTYLEEFFKSHGIVVITAADEEPKKHILDLKKDLIEVAKTFAGEVFKKRSRRYRDLIDTIEKTFAI